MTFRPVSHCGALVCLLLAAGCAAGRSAGTASQAGAPPSRSTASTSQLAPRVRGSTEVERDRSPAGSDNTVVVARADAAEAARDRNRQTLALIDDELRDATPEERERYLAEFRTMSPGAIRDMLRGRRLAMGEKPATRTPPAALPFGHDHGSSLAKSRDASASAADSRSRDLPVSQTSDGGRPVPFPGANDLQDPGRVRQADLQSGQQPVVELAPPATVSRPPTAARPASGTSQEELARLIPLFEREANAPPAGSDPQQQQDYLKAQIELRMLYFMAGQPERALQAIPGVDAADQEVWQQVFWGLTNYFDSTSIPEPAERAGQTATQFQNAVLKLQEKARLELRNVTFCYKVLSFGNYEKFPREEFSPGQEVLVYAEVANIVSEPATDGKFRTNLKSTLEILGADGASDPAQRIEMPATVDLCRTHRRDYFHVYQFTIPPGLSVGPHQLKVIVEDQIGHRTTDFTLNFTVK